MSSESPETEADRVRERNLDAEELLDIYVFEERANEYAFSYT